MAPFGVPAAMTESEQEAALISAHASNLAAGIAGLPASLLINHQFSLGDRLHSIFCASEDA